MLTTQQLTPHDREYHTTVIIQPNKQYPTNSQQATKEFGNTAPTLVNPPQLGSREHRRDITATSFVQYLRESEGGWAMDE